MVNIWLVYGISMVNIWLVYGELWLIMETVGSWSVLLKDFQYLEIDFLILRVVCGSSMFFSLIYFWGWGWKLMFHITFRLTLLQRSLGPQKEFLLWACNMTGWWFGTCSIFPYIGNNNPNWQIFFRGVGIPPTRWLHTFCVSHVSCGEVPELGKSLAFVGGVRNRAGLLLNYPPVVSK